MSPLPTPYDTARALLGDPGGLLRACARLSRLPPAERAWGVARFLSQTLGFHWACVARLEMGGRTYASVAVCHQGRRGPDFRHPLAGHLAADLLQGPRRYLTGVRRLYPRDPLLAAAGAEYAAGTPVAGRGFLAVFHGQARPPEPAFAALLELLAALAAPALEHHEQRASHAALAHSNVLLRQEIQRRIAVEDRLRRQADILDRLDSAVIAVDAKGYLQGWNGGAQRLLGYGEEEVLGRPLGDIWPAGGQDSELRRRLAGNAGHWYTDTELRDRAGRLLPVTLTVHRAGDGLILVAGDRRQARRAQRALERSEERYRRLVERMQEGLAIMDVEGRIQFVNDALCRLSGYPRDALVGSTPQAHLWDGRDLARLQREIARRREGARGAYEMTWRHRNGSPIYTLVSAEPLYDADGRYEGSFAVITDITTRHQEEQARLASLRQQRDVLVREVHHRIKNNLQGVVGLLRRHLGGRRSAVTALDAAIRQVNAVALVHGLQADTSHDRIILCELLPAVAQSAAAQRGAPAPEVEIRVRRPVRLAAREAVPVALVINELVTNALKHGAGAPVRLAIEGGPRRVAVLIQSAGRLPPAFDFQAGQGLGTGLTLVRALLPEPAGRLEIGGADGCVLARLVLEPPAVSED